MTKQLILAVFATISLIACKNETKKEQVAVPVVNTQVESKNETAQNNYVVGSQVPNDLVCMVNNAIWASLKYQCL